MKAGIALLLALVGTFALGASAQNWKPYLVGNWVGTCVQTAYTTDPEGTSINCLPNHGKTKIRYKIQFTYTETTYNFTNEAGQVRAPGGKRYNYPAYESPVGNYTTTGSGDETACTHVKFSDGGKAAFANYIIRAGTQLFYIEEGIYRFDNTPKNTCPYWIGMGLRCVRGRGYYTYSCVAKKLV